MADVNNSLRKRRSSSVEIIIEVSSDNVSPLQSPNIDNVEPEPKIARKEELIETHDSNLFPELSQNSVETNVSVQEKIMELQEENMKLKRQLQDVNCKLCKCSLDLSEKRNVNCEVDGRDIPLISIKFHDESVADKYRTKFQSFLASFMEFTHKSNTLEIDILRNDDDDLIPLELTPQDPNKSKRKRKKKKSHSSLDLFVVDTTPSGTKESQDLKYTSKYSVIQTDTDTDEKKADAKPVYVQTCFNCDRNHSLRDCPEPRNFTKINMARQKMKSNQQNKVRYHLEEDQKYSHLLPGKVSEYLKSALGVHGQQLPEYIYRMRMIGYPPGWMEEAQVVHSDMSLYDIEGKDVRCKKMRQGNVDPSKVVEYIGFNMPLDQGMRDDYRFFKCPPYSEKCSKSAMLEFIRKMEEKKKDNLEACDMEIDLTTDEEIAPPGCQPRNNSSEETENLSNRISPSLTDLEKKKLELLAALGESNMNKSSVDEAAVNNNNNESETGQVKNLMREASTDVNEVDLVMADEGKGEEASSQVKDESGGEKDSAQTQTETLTESEGMNTVVVEREETAKSETSTQSKEVNNAVVKTRETAEFQEKLTEANKSSEEETGVKESESAVENPSTPVSEVKKSLFGTPIVKSASPFNSLPHPDNFSKGVSPVINFENLPNSTGKYEQMTGVLNKVRRTLKLLGERS